MFSSTSAPATKIESKAEVRLLFYWFIISSNFHFCCFKCLLKTKKKECFVKAKCCTLKLQTNITAV